MQADNSEDEEIEFLLPPPRDRDAGRGNGRAGAILLVMFLVALNILALAILLNPPWARELRRLSNLALAPARGPSAAPTSAALPGAASAPTVPPDLPPNIYITSLRVEPDPPKRGQELVFMVTFLNTTDAQHSLRWQVLIYRPGNLGHSLGETSVAGVNDLPRGALELRAAGSWRMSGPGPCEQVIVRVVRVAEGQVAPLIRPDGQFFEHGMSVCP